MKVWKGVLSELSGVNFGPSYSLVACMYIGKLPHDAA